LLKIVLKNKLKDPQEDTTIIIITTITEIMIDKDPLLVTIVVNKVTCLENVKPLRRKENKEVIIMIDKVQPLVTIVVNKVTCLENVKPPRRKENIRVIIMIDKVEIDNKVDIKEDMITTIEMKTEDKVNVIIVTKPVTWLEIVNKKKVKDNKVDIETTTEVMITIEMIDKKEVIEEIDKKEILPKAHVTIVKVKVILLILVLKKDKKENKQLNLVTIVTRKVISLEIVPLSHKIEINDFHLFFLTS